MRRIIAVLTVLAIMAALVVATAAPAVATHKLDHCPPGQSLFNFGDFRVCVGFTLPDF